MSKGPKVVMEWSPEDAECIADVVHTAALNKQGRIWDVGLEEDAREIRRQIKGLTEGATGHV